MLYYATFCCTIEIGVFSPKVPVPTAIGAASFHPAMMTLVCREIKSNTHLKQLPLDEEVVAND